jgi:hypothetical protein
MPHRMPKVWIADLNLPGYLISPGYAMSLVSYVDLGVGYEVYMDNDDFIEIERGDEDEDGSL